MNDTDLENRIVDFIRLVIGPADIADLVAYFPDAEEMRVRRLTVRLINDRRLVLTNDMRLAVPHERISPQGLARLANAACEAAVEQCRSIDGPVNWGALECVAAEWYEADNGACGYRVYLEEASPAAHALQAFIAEWLAARGVDNVVVVTDW